MWKIVGLAKLKLYSLGKRQNEQCFTSSSAAHRPN